MPAYVRISEFLSIVLGFGTLTSCSYCSGGEICLQTEVAEGDSEEVSLRERRQRVF